MRNWDTPEGWAGNTEDSRWVADENWAGPEPAIDGSENELAVEAYAARISTGQLLNQVIKLEDELAYPKKVMTYLAKSRSQTSSLTGWRLYDRKCDASRYSNGTMQTAITVYDNGTWEYGIHG